MAIIPQLKLFGWNEIEKLGDLERLRLVLEHMPDEDLMQALERKRNKGRSGQGRLEFHLSRHRLSTSLHRELAPRTQT